MFFRMNFTVSSLVTEVQIEHRIQPVPEQHSVPIELSLFHSGPATATCRAECEQEPEAPVRSMFEALSRKVLPEGYKHPSGPRRIWFDESGNPLPSVPEVAYMPTPFVKFFEDVFGTMRVAVIDFLNVLRWRFNNSGFEYYTAVDAHNYSFDGHE
jgi:hypothetical protein